MESQPRIHGRGQRGIPLRVLVTTPFLLLLVATVGLTGWLLIWNGLEAADEITAELSREVGRRVEDYLAGYLQEAHLVNDLNADAVLQGELDDWGSDALGRHFWYQLKRFENLSFVFLGTSHGGAAGAGRVGNRIIVDTTAADRDLGLVAGTRREYVALEGGLRGEELEPTEGFDARQRPWFVRAREHGGPVWSEVYRFARDENTLAIAASRPVYEPGGELWGVLGVDLELEQIGRFLRTISDPGQVAVFEPDGALIATSVDLAARPEAAPDTRRLAWQTGDRAMDAAALDAFYRIRELEATDRWSAAIRGEKVARGEPDPTSFPIDLEGRRSLFSEDRYLVKIDGHFDPRGLDWRIVTVIPQASFLEGIIPGTHATVAVCAGALLLAMILGFLLSGWIARPVERLTRATHAMAAGEWSAEVPGGRIRELADLSASFNRMGGELKEAFEVLEERVAERTAELERATAAAVAANEAKTEFLATVSHEVRTPLSTILGYVDLLRDRHDDPERVDRHLRTIRDSGNHLNHLVGDLLDVGRIEAGRLELDPGPCELADLVAQLRSMFAARAAERGLDLLIETTDELPWHFVADAVRIRQIVSNLLSNALRYTEDGQVRLVVSARADSTGRDTTGRETAVRDTAELSFAVIDTGVGIRPEDRARIFERFTQVDRVSTAGRSVGFGLGLWITRQLAERMGGRVEFTSELGVGSTFTATLPVTDCSDWGVRQIERAAPLDPLHEPPLDGRVLVAEDSAGLRDLCRERLESWGIECRTVEDGRGAIAAAEAGSFDVVLMDWQMPHVDGLEATRSLRRSGVRTPIIALTAAAMHGDRERCLAAGCDRYLVKPIDFRALYRALAEYLPRAAAESSMVRATGSIIEDLAARYVDRLPAQILDVERGLDERDWPRLGAITHRLVGTAGSYGLSEVQSAVRALESAVASADPAAARCHLDELRAAVDLLRSRRESHRGKNTKEAAR